AALCSRTKFVGGRGCDLWGRISGSLRSARRHRYFIVRASAIHQEPPLLQVEPIARWDRMDDDAAEREQIAVLERREVAVRHTAGVDDHHGAAPDHIKNM